MSQMSKLSSTVIVPGATAFLGALATGPAIAAMIRYQSGRLDTSLPHSPFLSILIWSLSILFAFCWHPVWMRMNCQNTTRCPLLQAGYRAPQSSNMRAMLPETYDEEIGSARAKKRNDAINLFVFNKMAGHLNGMPPPFGNGRLYEPFVKSLSIRFDRLRHIWSDGDNQPGVCRRWLNYGNGLEWSAKQLA